MFACHLLNIGKQGFMVTSWNDLTKPDVHPVTGKWLSCIPAEVLGEFLQVLKTFLLRKAEKWREATIGPNGRGNGLGVSYAIGIVAVEVGEK